MQGCEGCAFFALWPLGSLRSLRSRRPLVALGSLRSSGPLFAFCSGRPLRSRRSLFALDALSTGRALVALGSLRSSGPLFAFCSRRPLRSRWALLRAGRQRNRGGQNGNHDYRAHGLPNNMRVEVDGGIEVSAKTVGELRKTTTWPDNLAINRPPENYPGSAVKVSWANGPGRTTPKP